MSTNESAGFFGQIAHNDPDDAEIPAGVDRDRYGRPLIVTREGEIKPYTRASTMVNYIKSTHGLTTWQKRLIVRGMGQREDLAAMASALPAYSGNQEYDAQIKEQLDEIMEEALITAKAYEGAHWGTAIHAFTNPMHSSGPVPERMRKDVASYEQVREATGMVRYASELFVVNHDLQVAGTLDSLEAIPALNAALVSDTKTGKQDLHSTAIQEAVYANSEVYDVQARATTETLRDFTMRALGADIFNPTMGLYTHIPKGEGVTTLHPLNLVKGLEMAHICAQVRDYQRDKSFAKEDAVDYLVQQRNVEVIEAINQAKTIEELKAVFKANEWRWNERLDKVGGTRMAEIGGPR